MKQYEYCTRAIGYNHICEDELNELGKDGWELCGIVRPLRLNDAHELGGEMIFKREFISQQTINALFDLAETIIPMEI